MTGTTYDTSPWTPPYRVCDACEDAEPVRSDRFGNASLGVGTRGEIGRCDRPEHFTREQGENDVPGGRDQGQDAGTGPSTGAREDEPYDRETTGSSDAPSTRRLYRTRQGGAGSDVDQPNQATASARATDKQRPPAAPSVSRDTPAVESEAASRTPGRVARTPAKDVRRNSAR